MLFVCLSGGDRVVCYFHEQASRSASAWFERDNNEDGSCPMKLSVRYYMVPQYAVTNLVHFLRIHGLPFGYSTLMTALARGCGVGLCRTHVELDSSRSDVTPPPFPPSLDSSPRTCQVVRVRQTAGTFRERSLAGYILDSGIVGKRKARDCVCARARAC